MSLFTNVGIKAKESASKKNVDLKAAYIRLKENESTRVRILGVTDYVEYLAHGEFNLNIFTTPCRNGMDGQLDPMCIAAKSGIDGFEKLRPKKRYIFAMYDIDKKTIRFWDASKSQATKLIGDIEEYADSLDEIAFNFKRTGQKTETVYSLNPILKLDAAGKEGFEAGGTVEVKMEDYEAVLIPKTVEQQIEALKQAGFPVDEFFGAGAGTEATDEVEDTDLEADENPLDVM
ncbi:hypothetical protein ABEX38_29765 [Priestia megaterium]